MLRRGALRRALSLTAAKCRDTVCHMKEISVRELHSRTGHWLREVAKYGEIRVTNNGTPIAKLVPSTPALEVPYFARRKKSAAFERLERRGKLRGGRDATIGITEEREDREL